MQGVLQSPHPDPTVVTRPRLIQREPGGWTLATGDPFGEERGFAEASRGRDEGQFAVQPLDEALDEAGAGASAASGWERAASVQLNTFCAATRKWM